MKALWLVFLVFSALAHAEGWVSLEGRFSCHSPHQVLCDAQSNPNLAALQQHLSGVGARLRAEGERFDREPPAGVCADLESEACASRRREDVWKAVFPSVREAELRQLFEETRESARRFLDRKAARTAQEDLDPAMKAERLALLGLAQRRLGEMTAQLYQTEEVLRTGSRAEATRYFTRENVLEFGFLSLLPASYDNAIRVVLGHEITHSFGPYMLFAIERELQPTIVEGVAVRSIYRPSYPFTEEVAQLPAAYQGADRACLAPVRERLRAEMERDAPHVRNCNDGLCINQVQAIGSCMKACLDHPDRPACEVSCAPLRAQLAQCYDRVCSPAQRELNRQQVVRRAAFDNVVQLLANPYAGGNRHVPECGRAQTEESLGDHLGYVWAAEFLGGEREALRQMYEATATMFCQLLPPSSGDATSGEHPPTTERIDVIHLAVPGIRESTACVE